VELSTGAGADAVAELLPDGVVVADEQQQVVYANSVAMRLVGPTLQVGAPLRDALALQDRDGHDWFGAVDPYGGLGTRSRIPEQSWLAADGVEVLLTVRLHREAPGRPVRRVGVVIRSGRGRERLDRERSDLVATVAHELRSPLTGVKGFVTTLLNNWDRFNDEQKKLMLTTVSADSERLSRLITELLDVARIDTGRLPLYPREVELDPVIARVVALVRAGTSRQVEHVRGHEVGPILADPDKLVQVVTNLVDNAVRHGEGSVRVTTEPLPHGVRMVVDDEGEGIAEAIRRRVFTKFWKHGERGGTGLGMYIVNGLVQAHGGDLVIGESPGGGARITVDWPAPEPETGAQPADGTS
jgi:signal transduction histidine kinase